MRTGTGLQPCRFQEKQHKGPTTSWLGTISAVLGNVLSVTKILTFTYRRVEPDEERAQGRRRASDLSASDACGRPGRDRTKEATLGKGVEQGVTRDIAARQTTNESDQSEQKRDLRTEHLGDTSQTRDETKTSRLARTQAATVTTPTRGHGLIDAQNAGPLSHDNLDSNRISRPPFWPNPGRLPPRVHVPQSCGKDENVCVRDDGKAENVFTEYYFTLPFQVHLILPITLINTKH